MTCSSNQKQSFQDAYIHLLKNSSVNRSEYYTKLEKNWYDRAKIITDEHLSFAQRMNEIENFPTIPQKATNIQEMSNLIKEIQSNLPPEIISILNKHLFGLFFCKNLGSTGLVSYIYNKNEVVGGFIIIDVDHINRSANDWITNKELSVFDTEELKLQLTIHNDKKNNSIYALQYILLHELGHIFSIVNHLFPEPTQENVNYSDLAILKDVWINKDKSKYDDTLPLRNQIRFYSNKRVNLDKNWTQIYPNLKTTKFPTLYSVVDPEEYIAELFVSYVHCVILKEPWTLKILSNSSEIYEMGNGILDDTNKSERKLIQSLIDKYK